MHQALGVCRGKARRGLHGDAKDLAQVQWTFTINPLLQRFSGNELHDQKRSFAFGFDIVNRDDVFMYHGRCRTSFAVEAMDFGIEESLRASNMLDGGLTVAEFAAGIESLAAQQGEIHAFQYELLLESRRRPELRPTAERYYRSYREAIDAQLRRLGVDEPGFSDLVWFALDGLVFNQLVMPSEVDGALARLRELVEAAARG